MRNEITELRGRLGISQTELANRLGVSQATVSRLESGKLPISQRTRLALREIERSATSDRAA